MMKIDGRLTKLEQRAKRTLRCDWCRYILHDSPPSMQKLYAADPNSHITVYCPYCGTEFRVNVSACDEHERDVTVLCYNREWGAVYRDPRVFAAIQWCIHQPTLIKWRTGFLANEKVEARRKTREQELSKQRYEKKKEDRVTRARKELKERAFSFIQQMHDREEKEFGPHSFPLTSSTSRAAASTGSR
jgi:hypothetical protein